MCRDGLGLLPVNPATVGAHRMKQMMPVQASWCLLAIAIVHYVHGHVVAHETYIRIRKTGSIRRRAVTLFRRRRTISRRDAQGRIDVAMVPKLKSAPPGIGACGCIHTQAVLHTCLHDGLRHT